MRHRCRRVVIRVPRLSRRQRAGPRRHERQRRRRHRAHPSRRGTDRRRQPRRRRRRQGNRRARVGLVPRRRETHRLGRLGEGHRGRRRRHVVVIGATCHRHGHRTRACASHRQHAARFSTACRGARGHDIALGSASRPPRGGQGEVRPEGARRRRQRQRSLIRLGDGDRLGRRCQPGSRIRDGVGTWRTSDPQTDERRRSCDCRGVTRAHHGACGQGCRDHIRGRRHLVASCVLDLHHGLGGEGRTIGCSGGTRGEHEFGCGTDRHREVARRGRSEASRCKRQRVVGAGGTCECEIGECCDAVDCADRRRPADGSRPRGNHNGCRRGLDDEIVGVKHLDDRLSRKRRSCTGANWLGRDAQLGCSARDTEHERSRRRLCVCHTVERRRRRRSNLVLACRECASSA